MAVSFANAGETAAAAKPVPKLPITCRRDKDFPELSFPSVMLSPLKWFVCTGCAMR
jgi:hypothetical protein